MGVCGGGEAMCGGGEGSEAVCVCLLKLQPTIIGRQP